MNFLLNIIDKIEKIEYPINILLEGVPILTNKIEKLENKRRVVMQNISQKRKKISEALSIVLLLTVLFTGVYSAIEYYRGDYAIYEKVSNGARCNDGWISRSQGPGTCSWHGGVDHYIFKEIQVGYHYADPEKYLIIFISLCLFAVLFLGLNLFMRILYLELLVKLILLIFFILVFLIATPIMALRVSLHISVAIIGLAFAFVNLIYNWVYKIFTKIAS